MNKKEEIFKTLTDFFSEKSEVVFVYVFGSFVTKEKNLDIDIGIYMDPVPDLIRQGQLQSELEGMIPHKIDLILLNKIPDENPAFAYEVLTKGKLLLNKDTSLHTEYKSKAFRYYFDTAYLRDKVSQAFLRRLESDKFGARDYE